MSGEQRSHYPYFSYHKNIHQKDHQEAVNRDIEEALKKRQQQTNPQEPITLVTTTTTVTYVYDEQDATSQKPG